MERIKVPHSLGPWKIDSRIKSGISDATGQKHVAMVNWFNCADDESRRIIKEEHEANTRLIAAAPELLEELLYRYEQTKCGCGSPGCKRCKDDAQTEKVLRKV